MKLYRLSQTVNNNYDTYDSCIVAAESEEEAAKIHPGWYDGTTDWWENSYEGSCWCYSIEDVECEYIGEAAEHITKGVVLASFNAG